MLPHCGVDRIPQIPVLLPDVETVHIAIPWTIAVHRWNPIKTNASVAALCHRLKPLETVVITHLHYSVWSLPIRAHLGRIFGVDNGSIRDIGIDIL